MRISAWVPAALLLFFSSATVALAQADEDLASLKPGPRAGWRSVTRLRGQISFQSESASMKALENSSRKLTAAQHFHATLELELDRDLVRQNPDRVVWRVVRADGSGGKSGDYLITGTLNTLLRGMYEGGFSGPLDLGTRPPAVSLDLNTGKWSFFMAINPVSPGTTTTTFNHREPTQTTSDTTTEPWSGPILSPSIYATVPNAVGPFSGRNTVQREYKQGIDGLGGEGQGNDHVTVHFWPLLPDVELKVRLDRYPTWRPEGNVAQPDRAGGQPLVVTAVLRSKEKGQPPPIARELVFTLNSTSREPGICLNWPLGAKDQNPDLRLALPPGLGSRATLDADGQNARFSTLIVVPGGGAGEVGGLVNVESFDFGAKSTLHVTARLADGRTVTGECDELPVLPAFINLPYSPGEGWIAEAWIKQQGLALKEEDIDDDAKPTGDAHRGDGFSLYEEYRGWVVDGRHVSGDPKKKDLFVLNLGEPAILNGVQSFEVMTDLKVHRLKPGEMDPAKRAMNANRTKGPHRVTQHGIVIRTDPALRGGMTDMVSGRAYQLPGRPKFVKQIRIGPRTPPEGNLAPPGVASIAGFHESAIAHELLHAVGVEHHGEGDGGTTLEYRFAGDPRAPSAAPGFWETSLGVRDPVNVLGEDGTNYARKIAPAMEELRRVARGLFGDSVTAGVAAARAARAGYTDLLTAEQLYEIGINDIVRTWSMQRHLVGAWQGQGAGDTGCVMRYYFSEIYPKKGDPSIYYRVAPHSEPVGHHICRAADGTGINEPNRKPQSRYGPATANRGNCLGQLCVNDAIPPKKR